MSDWASSLTPRFRDQSSSAWHTAAGKVSSGQQMLSKGANELQNGSGIMAASRNPAVTSMYVGQLTDTLKSWTATPGQVAASFEDGMARVSTVLNEQNAIGGDTIASMRAIENAAAEMAGGVSDAGRLAAIGTDVFSNSVYTMLSSGLSVEQGIAATEQASLLAKATGGNMADAASALTGIYNNLGNKSAEAGVEMTRLSDIVAGTQNYFAFENLGQFTDGLKNASGAAVANNIPLTQLVATIGQLNSNMITGSEAGTAVKTIIAQLGNATGKLGFEIARTDEGGIDLVRTFANIRATGADGQAMISAFGTEAGPAISLLTKNLDALRGGFDYVNGSAGMTLQNASKMSDTLTTRQENLNAAMQVWQGRVGEGSNAVKGLGVGMKLAGVQLLNWTSSIPGVGKALSGASGLVIELAGGFAGLANRSLQTATGMASMLGLWEKRGSILQIAKGGLTMVSGGLGKMSAGLIAGGKAFISAIPGAIAWMGTMWGVAAAHLAVYWPIYAVVAAVAAVAGVAFLVVRNWDKVKAWFGNAWATIRGWFRQGFDFIKGLFTESPGWIQGALLVFAPFIAIPMQIIKHWETIKGWFTAFVDWIVGIAQKIAQPFEWIADKTKGLFGRNSGASIGTAMADGMAADNSLYSATAASFHQVDRLIPHSDAKEGPFSRLTDAGRAILGTMARGVGDTAPLKDAKGATARAFGKLIPGTGTSGPAKVENHYNVNISFDELRDFPSLLEYLTLLKEETDRVREESA